MGRLPSYLRFYRRRWQLTQEELAFLIGYGTESMISRFEHGERTITLGAAAAFQTVFGVEARELFPGVFESVEERVLQRMRELHDQLLQATPAQRTMAKLKLLQDGLARLSIAQDQRQA